MDLSTLKFILDNNDLGTVALVFLLYVVVVLTPLCGLLYVVYFLLTLPLRRKERARIFIDLLESGMAEGLSPEQALAISAPRPVRPLGKRFNTFASHLSAGLRLSQALDLVPNVVPPQVAAMLRAGERVGDVRKVLPACRVHLAGPLSQVRAAINYLVLIAFLVNPVAILVPLFISTRVLPRFFEIFSAMIPGASLPAFTRFVFGETRTFVLLQIIFLVVIMATLVVYIAGPRSQRWLNSFFPGAGDRLAFALPWKRKRLLRDFSSMLAILLDSGMPEAEAVTLAAESTANTAIIRRAETVRGLLRKGTPLPQAMSAMDNVGEFRWRLKNAVHRRRRFFDALQGWHEALNAKAFQQEQAAAQVTTSGLVLINGLFVGCVVLAVFLVLISLIQGATLW